MILSTPLKPIMSLCTVSYMWKQLTKRFLCSYYNDTGKGKLTQSDSAANGTEPLTKRRLARSLTPWLLCDTCISRSFSRGISLWCPRQIRHNYNSWHSFTRTIVMLIYILKISLTKIISYSEISCTRSSWHFNQYLTQENASWHFH